MKICVGEEHTLAALNRVKWVQTTFDSSVYKFTVEGFLINDYYIEFFDDKYATLYYLQFPK